MSNQNPKSPLYPPRLPKRLEKASLDTLSDGGQYAQALLVKDQAAGAKASEILFDQVSLRQVVLTQSHFAGLRIFDSRLEGCELSGVQWEASRFRRVELRGCRLLGADLSQASFEDVLFYDCKGERAIFLSAAFKAVRFEKCDFREASFEGADLTGAIFAECNLRKADLRGAKLAGADLRTSIIDGMQVGIKELQGAIIDPLQAVQVVSLLGLVVKENETPDSFFTREAGEK